MKGTVATIATVVLGFFLALFVAVFIRGVQAPELYTSTALIEPLVEPKDVKKHMRERSVLEAVQIMDTIDLKTLSRRLTLRTVSRRQHIELKASDRDPEHARALLQRWLDAGLDLWTADSPQGIGPFIMIESPTVR